MRNVRDDLAAPQSALDRLGWSLLAAASAALLTTARLLTPDVSGVGTHMQLGLPACGFLLLFGKPCPACGLTTAFAHLAHFSLLDSLRANPVGLPLFLLTIGLLLGSLHALWRRDPLSRLVQGELPLRIALGLCLALLGVWAVRLTGSLR